MFGVIISPATKNRVVPRNVSAARLENDFAFDRRNVPKVLERCV
jgi:hypothetical protein